MAIRLNAALEGRYRIEREVGAGGMATVYLAEDLRHERRVALKVLKPELAAVVGAERFLAEIKTTANLQHPHILPLFDSGEADGFLFYVMPYAVGESLREKLDREHQLRVEEAVRIASDLAEALDHAHRHGVIHRDIKPANILLLEGRPLLADFGIALAVSAGGGGRLTETGLSLGTPHYMSPEQATGDQSVGPATDLYALGCVLYEMLVGEPPYTGSTPQAVLGRIITGEVPSAGKHRTSVPVNVDAAISRALEKVPADRFAGAQGFASALADPAFRHGATAEEVVGERTRSVWLLAGALAAGLLVGALGTVFWSEARRVPGSAEVMRLSIVLPDEAAIVSDVLAHDLAITPDGARVVYAGRTTGGSAQLRIRSLNQLGSSPLPGTEGAAGPFVSPDGEWIGFTASQGGLPLRKVSILGGPPVTVIDDFEGPIRGASWGDDGTIILGTASGGLFRVSADGGVPEPLTESDVRQDERGHISPHFIEDRNAALFVIFAAGGGSPLFGGQLAALDLDTGQVTRLGIAGVSPRYVSTGHLVYADADGTLWAVAFDVGSLEIRGSPVPILEGVQVKAAGAANFDIAYDGHLLYVDAATAGGSARALFWVGRNGSQEMVPAPQRQYQYARLSPSGGRAALDIRDAANDIAMWDFSAETLTPLILSDGPQMYPVWTPDGGRIAYGTGAGGIRWKAANNTGPEELLVAGDGLADLNPYFFTHDGTGLVFRDQSNPETGEDLVMIRVGSDEPVWRMSGAFRERNADLSPDGRWMAYQSDEAGGWQVYVRPFPEVEEDQVQVSNNGGVKPLWSRDGRELFYLQPGAPDELISVTFDGDAPDEAFSIRERRVLREWPFSVTNLGREYDVSPDGQRFLTVGNPTNTEIERRSQLTIVLNWLRELQERVPAR